MADNFTTKDATDVTITGAADEIGGVKFPRVKMIIGADGVNDGDVSATNPLPVKCAANSGVDIGDVDVTSCALPTGAATSAKQDTIITAVQLIDDIVGALKGPGSPTIDSYANVAINLAAGANQVLVSSAANKQIWVYGYTIIANVAGTVSFQDEDDTAISGIMPIDAKGGIARNPSGNFAMPIWKLATDKDLEIDIVTSEIDGDLQYAIVSV